jgi:hypothetical protein
MKKLLFPGLLVLAFVGCASNAQVEVGLIDEALVGRAPLGNLYMRVLKIELPVNGDYTSIWEGTKPVSVAIQNGTFASITDTKVDVAPDRYKTIRITVDSLCFMNGTDSTLLVGGTIQFVAEAFTEIIVSDGDELTFSINIVSQNWFDPDSQKIITNHDPFEGASLKLRY